VRPAVEQDAGHRPARGPVAAGGQFECLAEEPVAAGEVDQAGRPSAIGAGHGTWREPFAARFPSDDEVMAVGIAEGVHGSAQSVVGALVDVDQPGQRRSDPEVEPVTFGVERIRDGLLDLATGGRGESRGRGRIDGPPASPLAAGDGGAVGRVGLGGCHEALQVTESVAAVASRVDPVVAQAPGVAPCPDRVRVHAKKPGGLGDRQGRVRWSSGE
jgi:hypothetical protein